MHHAGCRAWSSTSVGTVGRSDAAVSAVRCDPYASSSPWASRRRAGAVPSATGPQGRAIIKFRRCTASCILLARVLCAGKWPCTTDDASRASCSRCAPVAPDQLPYPAGERGTAATALSQVCKERILLAAPGVDVAPKPSIQSSYRRSTPGPRAPSSPRRRAQAA